MNAITQETLHHLLPGKMSAMVAMYIEDNGTSALEALRWLYKNDVYKQLEQESSKLWHLGPVALYELFKESIRKVE